MSLSFLAVATVLASGSGLPGRTLGRFDFEIRSVSGFSPRAGNTVPEPATLALVALAIAGIGPGRAALRMRNGC